MAAHRSPIALLATLAVTALVLATAPLQARADDARPSPEPLRHPVPTIEILEGIDRLEPGEDWMTLYLDRMHLSKKYGLTYTHEMRGSEKSMTFKLRGPVLGKPLSRRRRIGLSFEIEF